MAKSSGLNTRRALARATAAALTAALVATGTSAAVAADDPGRLASQVPLDAPASGAKSKFSASALPGDAPINPLYGVDNNGDMWGYDLDFEGGLEPRVDVGSDWQFTRFISQADRDADGFSDGIWEVTGDELYSASWGEYGTLIGKGWKIYNNVLSAGNLGGAAPDDMIARDGSGVLWLYLGYNDGKVDPRVKVGAGWNAYTHLAGKGDLTGDGKHDIVAKDSAGVLWLYQGTGNYKAPFAPRTKIGAGWNIYNNLVSVGDVDIDGTTDLIARDKAGALWLYKGTGNAAAPFSPPVKIGTTGWNTYRLLF
ncbi:FG-GAP repeat domain-containing protein [Streptomyces lancefieldiae]|uniref:VCBS repeat-containing protein n=1 Tax=Streptomyces lancefieldiae TaxID=3075520 RepID=A0ABU3AMT0_9ACTN|nr:VCBS repeat-containing protein [Streptomyces sp. DSM 40712]MDT0611502.1 VCBS repeat-containing protein [Streptomyces sp. DSM 40712]